MESFLETATYRGWLPNVSGRLSFSAFGRSTFPTRCKCSNIANGFGRFIVCYQSRFVSDVILPKLFREHLERRWFGQEGRMWFICIAQTEDINESRQEALKGAVFVLHSRVRWRDRAKLQVREAQTKLDALDPQSTDFQVRATEIVVSIKAELTELASYWCEFKIWRSGTTEIMIDLRKALEESDDKPKFKGDLQSIMHRITSQCFFFLRDIGHRHQHHNATTDTIVDLYDATKGDDLSWRLNTLYALYRKIIEYKRDIWSQSFYSSIGLLGYAKSFRATCLRELDASQRHRMPAYYSSAMRQSIEAKQAERNSREEGFKRQLEITTAQILAVFSLIVGLVGVLQISKTKINVETSSVLVWFAEFVMHDTLRFIALLLLFWVVLMSTLGGWNVGAFSPVKNFQRVFHFLKRRYAVVTLIFIGSVLVASGLYLLLG